MRKITVFAVVLVAVSGVAYAQQEKQTASLFLSDIEQSPDDRVHESWPSGFGGSFERMFAPRWSVQAAVAVERHVSYGYVREDNGAISLVDRAHLRTVPLDLTALYHWPNDTRWKPYLGLGAHYVAAPDADRRFRYQNHLEGEINGGTRFMLTRQFGVLLDGRVFLGDHESYDDSLKISLGANWRF